MRKISKELVKRKIELLNPHWQTGQVDKDVREKKPRKYFDLFFPLVKSTVQRAVVLMGPRRVGKTILLWHTIQKLMGQQIDPENILYLSVDDPIFHPYSLEDLLDLYKEIFSIEDLTNKIMIFDEIQYLKGWDVQLKVLVDTYKSAKFIVSGSAAGALKRKSTESGAGRFTDFMLPPLTFYEFLDLQDLTEELFSFGVENDDPFVKDINKLNSHFINYINYGGFPEAIFDEEIRKNPQRFIRSDIIDKVLLRDLPSLYGIQDTQELNRFFGALAYQTGNEVSYAGLSQASGVAKNTIRKYIEYLEAAFLIRTVKRIDESGKRFRRTNFFKVYLTNPSMYSALYGLVSEEDSGTLGSLVETAIFSQWMHAPQTLEKIFYARWKGGKGEVDMVLLDEKLDIYYCVEVKWSDRYIQHSKEFKNIIEFCKLNNLKRAWMTTKSKFLTIEPTKNLTLHFFPSSAFCFSWGYQIIQQQFLDKGLPWGKLN